MPTFDRSMPEAILFVMATSLAGLAIACQSKHQNEAGPGTIVEAVDDDGNPITLRIDAVEADPKDTEGEVRLYAVSIQSDNGWAPYCPPDVEGRSAAIPLAGSWHPVAGRLGAGKDVFTFACTSGAIGKCIRFGYKPWKKVDGVSLATYHDACVRMVRADYCGDGNSHTVNGTRIDVYDRLGIQKPEPNADTVEEFEAAWGRNGAVFLSVPRLSDDVADIVRHCPERFARRTSLEMQRTVGDIMQQFPEALVFNNRSKKPATHE